MPRPNESEFLEEVLLGNREAIVFVQTLAKVAQTLDDLVDGDRPVESGEIISMVWKSLIELPTNGFYRQCELYLRPLMALALQDWQDSVVLEQDGDLHDKTIAFVLRDQMAGLIVQCAYLVGGEDWMKKVGPAIRRHCHEDTLADYLRDLNANQKTDSGGHRV